MCTTNEAGFKTVTFRSYFGNDWCQAQNFDKMHLNIKLCATYQLYYTWGYSSRHLYGLYRSLHTILSAFKCSSLSWNFHYEHITNTVYNRKWCKISAPFGTQLKFTDHAPVQCVMAMHH